MLTVLSTYPDPGSGAFLTPGSMVRYTEWVKNRIWIRDEQPGSYFRELRNQFLGLKNLFRDKHPGSATLHVERELTTIQDITK
jgi:hypothetical protein